MHIEIDKNAGFCFGVKKAIESAETFLQEDENLFCLGEIVHNSIEVDRLNKMGLKTIDKTEFENLHQFKVLLRAHGEPPETYETAKRNNLKLIDATCPVVLKLQKRVAKAYNESKEINGQVLIYGKKDHPEIIGLAGQTENTAVVITHKNDLEKIDYNKPIQLFSQTTQSISGYSEIINIIKSRIEKLNIDINQHFKAHHTICGQVSGRDKKLKDFAQKNDLILFVSGKNSSNGKYLFDVCKEVNKKSYFISNEDELDEKWFKNISTVGISGATSTPLWLMQKIKEKIKELNR